MLPRVLCGWTDIFIMPILSEAAKAASKSPDTDLREL